LLLDKFRIGPLEVAEILVDRVLESLINAIYIPLISRRDVLHHMTFCDSKFQVLDSFLHIFEVCLTIERGETSLVNAFIPRWTLSMIPASVTKLTSRDGNIELFNWRCLRSLRKRF
jgi:hypothetical protein